MKMKCKQKVASRMFKRFKTIEKQEMNGNCYMSIDKKFEKMSILGFKSLLDLHTNKMAESLIKIDKNTLNDTDRDFIIKERIEYVVSKQQ